MQSLKISDIKKELQKKSSVELAELCMALAKYKVENKELLTYLLMDAEDEKGYIESCKTEIDDLFETVNTSSNYLAKKTLRKIARTASKRIKYSGNKQTEIEVLTYFIQKSLERKIKLNATTVIFNIYKMQWKKIQKALGTLHEDLQFDYRQGMKKMEGIFED